MRSHNCLFSILCILPILHAIRLRDVQHSAGVDADQDEKRLNDHRHKHHKTKCENPPPTGSVDTYMGPRTIRRYSLKSDWLPFERHDTKKKPSGQIMPGDVLELAEGCTGWTFGLVWYIERMWRLGKSVDFVGHGLPVNKNDVREATEVEILVHSTDLLNSSKFDHYAIR
eukprot:gnl/TRDRNA2_/TRDRNA2_173458_c0_seq3.p1 gnl/TRDRNA2_/TRDRNA2_173458_c0~~gnl/TRDRNA2_/TRDRNA2_173458_c0_seq3.p1  ORF type:complete len:170 (+),score=4.28 gnl/TRDRNA2_/TRDRNA2_173458_c0_seq3:44-553(+)